MDIIANLMLGFETALTLQNLGYCLFGVFVGTAIGVLPGLGPTATISMLLPATFALEPVSALIMLAGIFYGAQYGGSTTAILIKLPGEVSSIVTVIDGHKMASQGRAGAALAAAALASFTAGTVATFVIAVFAPPLALVAIEFGPAEYVSLMVLGLIASVVLASGPLLNAIGMVLLGLLLGVVGTDVNSGVHRFTLGFPQLASGLDFVVVAMGMFGLGEIIANLRTESDRDLVIAKVTNLVPRLADLKRIVAPTLRGTVLGSALGILPGGGAALASFSAYALEKKVSRHRSGARPRRDRRRCRAGGGQQRRVADILHSDAHARRPLQPGHGADDRRAPHPGRPARPGGHDAAADAFLGADRLHVDRQLHAGHPQPAAYRHVGQADFDPLPLPVPDHPDVLRDRRLQPRQRNLRHPRDGAVRGGRLPLQTPRLRACSAALGIAIRGLVLAYLRSVLCPLWQRLPILLGVGFGGPVG